MAAPLEQHDTLDHFGAVVETAAGDHSEGEEDRLEVAVNELQDAGDAAWVQRFLVERLRESQAWRLPEARVPSVLGKPLVVVEETVNELQETETAAEGALQGKGPFAAPVADARLRHGLEEGDFQPMDTLDHFVAEVETAAGERSVGEGDQPAGRLLWSQAWRPPEDEPTGTLGHFVADVVTAAGETSEDEEGKPAESRAGCGAAEAPPLAAPLEELEEALMKAAQVVEQAHEGHGGAVEAPPVADPLKGNLLKARIQAVRLRWSQAWRPPELVGVAEAVNMFQEAVNVAGGALQGKGPFTALWHSAR